MGWPIVRGIVNFVTMLSRGMSCAAAEAPTWLGMLDEEPTKFEKWLSKKLGKGIDKIVMAVAIVLAVVLSIGLFFVTRSSSRACSRRGCRTPPPTGSSTCSAAFCAS